VEQSTLQHIGRKHLDTDAACIQTLCGRLKAGSQAIDTSASADYQTVGKRPRAFVE
jgi:hypothetical protein